MPFALDQIPLGMPWFRNVKESFDLPWAGPPASGTRDTEFGRVRTCLHTILELVVMGMGRVGHKKSLPV